VKGKGGKHDYFLFLKGFSKPDFEKNESIPLRVELDMKYEKKVTNNITGNKQKIIPSACSGKYIMKHIPMLINEAAA
jgi:hypothetical protein